MIFKVLGIIVLLIGLYCLYLVIKPTGHSINSMNLICGIIFSLLGILLLIKKAK